MVSSTIRTLYYDRACFGRTLIATRVRPYYEYVDNKRTENVEGYRYTVVLPERGYEALDVKVPGAKALDIAAGESVNVEFSGLRVRAYVDFKTRDLAVTATADAIQAAASDGKRA